ncbi:MAG: ABC transporter ATP-binding protein [Planctomycetaceae bacterium]
MNPLVARDLSFRYTNQTILDRLSIELRAGEVLVLLGANGAGKTTLLQTLCDQLRPDAGVVLVDQEDIRKFKRRLLAKRIALMPQQENRDSQLRVVDVVSLGRTPHVGWWMPLSEEDHAAVRRSLEITGLTELQERRMTELSGGEWRRMILARALAQHASILLLDEPTAGLDLKYQLDVLVRIRAMARQCGLTVALTLHDLNHASMFADRIALLSDGKLLAIGTAREVLKPELIETAFGVRVTVMDHPVDGSPFVVPLYERGTD